VPLKGGEGEVPLARGVPSYVRVLTINDTVQRVALSVKLLLYNELTVVVFKTKYLIVQKLDPSVY
jgi:hypothetical protein